MTVELKIIAEDMTALLAKLAEVSKSTTSGGAARDVAQTPINDLIVAINRQLPEGMECTILDHQKGECLMLEKTEGLILEKTAEGVLLKKTGPTKTKPARKRGRKPLQKTVTKGQNGSDDGNTDTVQSDFDIALDILAVCYVEDNGKAAVNSLLKKHNARRFADIDPIKGPDLLKAANKIKADCGL